MGMLASGPMALLSGFTLASAVALGLEDDPELLESVALLLFSIAAGVLLWGLHLSSEAEGLNAAPGDYLDWYPELRISDWEYRDWIRFRQRQEFAAYFAVRRRGLNAYHLGTTVTVTGLAAFLGAQIDGRQFDLTSSDDTIREVGFGLAALILLMVGIGILSYAPAIHEWRYWWMRSADPKDKRARSLEDTRFDRAVRDGAKRLVKIDPLAGTSKVDMFTEVDESDATF
jgi:hypothetical protein